MNEWVVQFNVADDRLGWWTFTKHTTRQKARDAIKGYKATDVERQKVDPEYPLFKYRIVQQEIV